MRLIWTAIVILVLSGCGTVSTTKMDVATLTNPTFELIDKRPVDARQSSKTHKPEGEITILGDDGITPSGPELLQAWLDKRFASRIAGKQLLLQEFSVEVTDPTVMVDNQGFNTAAASTPGVDPLSAMLAYWMITGIERAKSEKYVGVRISGKFGEHAFSSRGDGNFKGRVTESDINSIITQALDLAATQIDIFLLEEEQAVHTH